MSNFLNFATNADGVTGEIYSGLTLVGQITTTSYNILTDFSIATSKFTIAAATGNFASTGSATIATTASIGGSVTGASFIPTGSGIPTLGMFSPAANTIALSINSTEALRVDSLGSLGIGETPVTTTSTYKLLQVGKVVLAGRAGGTANSEFYLGVNANPIDDKYITSDYAAMFSSNDGAFWWKYGTAGTAGNTVSWSTVMALSAANGYLGIGTAPVYPLHINKSIADYFSVFNNSSATPYGQVWSYTAAAPNSTAQDFLICSDTGGTRLMIHSNGNVVNVNNSYGATSDRKLKQDFVEAGPQLGDVLSLSRAVSKFRYKTSPNGPLQIGWVAQDIQGISPGLVSAIPDMERVEIKDDQGNITGTELRDSGTVTLSVQHSVAQMKLFKAFSEMYDHFDGRLSELEAKVN